MISLLVTSIEEYYCTTEKRMLGRKIFSEDFINLFYTQNSTQRLLNKGERYLRSVRRLARLAGSAPYLYNKLFFIQFHREVYRIICNRLLS
jgi:hypothetical protein